MNSEATWGAIIGIWIALVAIPYFWLTAKVLNNKDADPPLLKILGPWIVGFLILLGLWKERFSPDVAIIFSGLFIVSWASFIVSRMQPIRSRMLELWTGMRAMMRGGWARLGMVGLIMWEARSIYIWWDLKQRCCYAMRSDDVSEAGLIALVSPPIAIFAFFVGKWIVAGFRNDVSPDN